MGDRIEEIKNKYMGMAEYASLRLGTTLDIMCCTVDEVGMLFKEIDALTKALILEEQRNAARSGVIDRLTKERDELKTRVEWPRCDEDISEGQGMLCNAELVDGGEGFGIFCPLCDIRDENAKLREEIESWKNSRDGVLAHIEQIEQEKLELVKETERLKEQLRTDVGGKW